MQVRWERYTAYLYRYVGTYRYRTWQLHGQQICTILGECEIVIPQIISEERPVGLFSSIRESSNGTCGIPKFGRDRRKAREVTKARGQFNAHTTGTDILIVVH